MPVQPTAVPPSTRDSDARGVPSPPMTAGAPVPRPKTLLCPYCGHLSLNPHRCGHCKGLFDPLSRQASQNSMGPWFLRDPANPFRPGCSFDTLRQLIQRRRITLDTILRGPTTRQFWVQARSVPCVANLLGECHACHAPAKPSDSACARCAASFSPVTDREFLGLAAVHLLPGSAAPEVIADATRAAPEGRLTTADDLRAAMPSASPTGFPVLASAVSAGDADPPRASALHAGAAVGGYQHEVVIARLQRRAARQATILWILAAALLIVVVLAILALLGPSLGVNLFPPSPAASALGGAVEAHSTLMPDSPADPHPPARTVAERTQTPAPSVVPSPAPVPTPSPAIAFNPPPPASASDMFPTILRLIAQDTPESLAEARSLLRAAAAGPSARGGTAPAAAAYLERRQVMLSVRARL